MATLRKDKFNDGHQENDNADGTTMHLGSASRTAVSSDGGPFLQQVKTLCTNRIAANLHCTWPVCSTVAAVAGGHDAATV